MRLSSPIVILVLAALAAPASAQPVMDTLWPNQDGMQWDYEYQLVQNELFEPYTPDYTSPAYLRLLGTITTPGGTAQVLFAEHDPPPQGFKNDAPDLPPLLRKIWRARPDLREAIVARYGDRNRPGYWSPLFLHDGYFMKNHTEIEMWQDTWDHPTWRYLEDDLTVGATFVMQLVPEFADDIFLHGTVAAVDATVETPAGSFDGAVRMDYLIDHGVSTLTDEEGNILGTSHTETVGHVHYVPDVGPVDMFEEWYPFVWLDCGEGDCPPEYEILVGEVSTTETLTLTRLPHVVAVGDFVPRIARLEQNHPNPFNPSTTISYDLAAPAAVSLRIFDVTGRLVASLIARQEQSAGPHAVVWNGRGDGGLDLPSGTYFYRLDAGGYVETRRMALVK